MRAGVTVRGASEVERAFDHFADRLEPLPDRAAAEAAAEVVRSRTPVRSGRLRRSVVVEQEAGGAFVTAGGRDVPYARPINYGWPSRDIAPARYLDPLPPDAERAAVTAYSQHADELVRRWDRETPG